MNFSVSSFENGDHPPEEKYLEIFKSCVQKLIICFGHRNSKTVKGHFRKKIAKKDKKGKP